MTLLKAIVGLCLGIALFSALQTVGVLSLQEYLKSGGTNSGLPIGNGTPLVTSFDADAFKNGVLPKYAPIDTTEGQRLGVESAARRVDIQTRNALSHVPRF
jgi:hypothetical protein